MSLYDKSHAKENDPHCVTGSVEMVEKQKPWQQKTTLHFAELRQRSSCFSKHRGAGTTPAGLVGGSTKVYAS